MSVESSVSGGSGSNHNGVPYDYFDKKANSGKVPKFNGDPEEFSWWKTNFYSYNVGLDEELWDILEDGVGDLDLDEEGPVVHRKKHTPAQKKMYRKHHKIRGSLVTTIPRAKYMKMSDKSTAKAMVSSLCANYEGSKKVMLEQNVFNITLKSFDDNKILKNCQFDLLIFVQVYRTIDKKFEIINRFWKNKRDQRNKQKESLKASEENCS